MYTLYVIPGSHACRSAMLMLDHKRVRYRRVDVPTLTHPVAVRLVGFRPSSETRIAGTKRPPALRFGDRTGTVPALAAGHERISTNRAIARFLDQRHPDPPLFPADHAQREAVEEAERWANETLQMAARRIALGGALHGLSAISRGGADGRMGYMLYRSALARRLIIPWIGRTAFAVDKTTERELTAELPALLDRVDRFIAEGILGGQQLNAADFMVAPSLALILYRLDTRPAFEGRPALELVDRILPDPDAGQTPAEGARRGTISGWRPPTATT
jgi:glutathione S-transferase